MPESGINHLVMLIIHYFILVWNCYVESVFFVICSLLVLS